MWWSSPNPPGEYMSCLAVPLSKTYLSSASSDNQRPLIYILYVYMRSRKAVTAWLAHRWSAFKELHVNRLLTHQQCPYHDRTLTLADCPSLSRFKQCPVRPPHQGNFSRMAACIRMCGTHERRYPGISLYKRVEFSRGPIPPRTKQ